MATYDKWYNHVAVHLHMDGSNNGTTFTDQKGHTITVNGSVVTSTTSPQFGTACGYFPGTDSDYLTLPNDDDYNFGSGSFTIEGWFKQNNVTRQYMTLLEKDSGGFPAGAWTLYMNHASNSAGDVAFVAKDYSGVTPVCVSTSGTFDDNAWHHVAVTRNRNIFTLYVDGVTKARTYSTVTFTDLAQHPTMGKSTNAGRAWTGYMDEWRITKGIARYTTAFTPSTTAFPETYDDGTAVGATGATGAPGRNIIGPMGPAGEDGPGWTPRRVALPSPPMAYVEQDQRETRRIIASIFE